MLGRRVELYGSIQHRNHHLDPADLGRVLLKPIEVISFIVQIAILDGADNARRRRAGRLAGPAVLALTAIAFSLSRATALRVVALSHPHPVRAQDTLVPDDLAKPSPAPIQARGLLDGCQFHPCGPGSPGINPDQRSISKSPTARTLGVAGLS